MGALSDLRKVLIIDDEEDLRDLLAFQFKSRGFDAMTAGDGVQALKALEQFSPHLIILDLNMPNMGGIDFYQKICGPDGRPMYPVLVLTARANTRQLFMDFEVDGFIAKPFDIQQLIQEAQAIVQKKFAKPPVLPGHAIKKVFVIDHDQNALNAIGLELLSREFHVWATANPVKAIEKITQEVPDAVLVNLGLSEIPGDLIVQRLSRLAKTAHIRLVLYIKKDEQHDKKVLENFGLKTAVARCVEYSQPTELIAALFD